MALDKIQASGIGNNVVALHHCDWYSDAGQLDAGGLKLPVGTTGERPTVVAGGREVVTFDLNVTANVPSNDPGFLQNEPWLWTWSANYNRTSAATRVTDTSSLTFFKGSTYTFRNQSVGHGLFLRHTEKTDSNDANNVYALTAAEGITSGTQGSMASAVGSPSTIVFAIPDNYPYSQVVIQHGQTGMANVIPVTDPPTETLGYIRVNTSNLAGADETTGTSVEYYTGQGWAGIGGSNANGNIIAHPTGTFDPAEDWNTDTGTYDWNTASGSEDWGPAIVTAFGAAGDISQNSDKALVAHDGSTGGGIPMMRADMSNLSVNLVNSKYNFFRSNAETLTDVAVTASNTSRLSFDNAIETGVSNIAVSDTNKVFTINKDISNAYFKFDIKIKPSDDCTLQIWKNGSHLTYADYELDSSYHATASWIEVANFGDTFEFRLYKSGGSSLTVTDKDTLLIEFIGS
tara:strand:- start:1324 stop:2700 length:1377 start_codon:yes stop_codon:yes gene_type:complete